MMKFQKGKEADFFDYLRQEDNDNKFCFECNAQPAGWASVTLGVFLCLKCAGIHRGLGVNISFVRSMTLDAWKPRQVEFMRHGGNSKARTFFSSTKECPKSEDDAYLPNDALQRLLEERYSTREAIKYKNKLKSEVDNAMGPDEIEIERSKKSPPPVVHQEKKYDKSVLAISSDGYVPKPHKDTGCCCNIM